LGRAGRRADDSAFACAIRQTAVICVPSPLKGDARGPTCPDDARMMPTHRWTAKVALTGVAVLALVCCGEDKPAVCAQADELEASVQDLLNVNISENGLGALSSSLGQVRTDLEQLVADAKTEFQPQIDMVTASVDQLSSSLSAATADPSATSLATVGTAARSLGDAVRALGDAVAETC
jgi:hypothetical protein